MLDIRQFSYRAFALFYLRRLPFATQMEYEYENTMRPDQTSLPVWLARHNKSFPSFIGFLNDFYKNESLMQRLLKPCGNAVLDTYQKDILTLQGKAA